MSKGSRSRVSDQKRFRDNYDRIFKSNNITVPKGALRDCSEKEKDLTWKIF